MRNKLSAFAVPILVTVMVAFGTGAEARETLEETQRTGGAAVGAEVVHPEEWNVERENYTYDGTYGYTLWYPDSDASHDHGGRPALRVALAYEMRPGDIEDEVGAIQDDYPDLDLVRETVGVAGDYEGVAVGLVPGSTPYTAVYVPVGDRVYEIDVYAREAGYEGLDAAAKELLADVRFEQPSETVASLDVPAANSPGALYPSGAEARSIEALDDTKAPPGSALPRLETSGTDPDARSSARRKKGNKRERRISGGCWRAGTRFYVQTQHGSKANRGKRDGIPTGWTTIGKPNFWGQYTHGNLGYGRCKEPNWANDKYAVDYPMNRGDYVFSPFSCGRVMFAGRNRTHADYGIFVAIRACNGKYVNLTAHMQGLRRGLSKGDRVTRQTVIGYAGDSGGGNIAVGPVHFHTAFYRKPQTNPDGSPYGGAGLQVVRNRYVGTAARRMDIKVRSNAYAYDRVRPKGAYCQERRRCGERFLVSN